MLSLCFYHMIKIVSGLHPAIPTPPIFYGGSELMAAMTANALIEEGFDVCLEAIPRSWKTWYYYFNTDPPKKECRDIDLTISYIKPAASEDNEKMVHVYQGVVFQLKRAIKVFASKPQYEVYKHLFGLVSGYLIPNTIPEWLYTPREKWDDGDYYLYLNRCDRNKGCEEFVNACIREKEKCYMITQFWFVEDVEYAKAVVEKARNNGIKVYVNVGPLEKIELIKNAKAVVGFLSERYFEGYGLWVHEANYLRVPVISTPVQAVPWTMMRGYLVEKPTFSQYLEEVRKDENEWREDRSYKRYKERWVKLMEEVI